MSQENQDLHNSNDIDVIITELYNKHEKYINAAQIQFKEDMKLDESLRDINIQGLQRALIRNTISKSNWISRLSKLKSEVVKYESLVSALYFKLHKKYSTGDRLLKGKELEMYIENDTKYMTHILRLRLHKEKVDFCDNAVKAITGRDYTLKNIIEAQKIYSM